jgi:hypothetical protein
VVGNKYKELTMKKLTPLTNAILQTLCDEVFKADGWRRLNPIGFTLEITEWLRKHLPCELTNGHLRRVAGAVAWLEAEGYLYGDVDVPFNNDGVCDGIGITKDGWEHWDRFSTEPDGWGVTQDCL